MSRAWPLLLLLPLVALVPIASADDDDEDEHHAPARPRAATDPAYAAECGSCHLAYPPGMLPAGSWAAIMKDLPHHFGDDATVAEPARTSIAAWLQANAGPSLPGGATPLRITETGWWRLEHDEIPASWAKDPAIRSFASCPACHTGAARGSFREGEIRIPGHGGWDD